MSKSVSILGCGWLGKAVGKALIDKGYSVKGSYRSEERKERIVKANIEAVHIDIDEGFKPEYATFFQADILMIAIPPSKFETENLISFLAEVDNSQFEQVILISSTGIYKDCNQLVRENTKEIKTEGSLYEIEGIVKRKFGQKVLVLRPGGLIGPGRNPANFITSENVLDNPRGRVNLVHLEDCVNIIVKCVDEGIVKNVFNLVMDDHPTKKEFYSAVAFMAGKKEPTFGGSKTRFFKMVSNEKAKQALNYTFIDIFDAVRMF